VRDPLKTVLRGSDPIEAKTPFSHSTTRLFNADKILHRPKQQNGCTRETEVCAETRNIDTLRTHSLTPKCCVENLSTLLLEASEFFVENELFCWLDWGSLLGIVREGNLLAWDRDVDFGFHVEQEHEIFEAFATHGKTYRAENGDFGFVLESGLFYVPQSGPDYFGNPAPIPRLYFSVSNRLYADLYPYYLTTSSKYGMGRLGPCTYDIDGKHIESLTTLKWRGIPVFVPCLTEEYLEKRYGTDWRIPDPNFYQKYPPGSRKLLEKLYG
jgi:hypothetical protein